MTNRINPAALRSVVRLVEGKLSHENSMAAKGTIGGFHAMCIREIERLLARIDRAAAATGLVCFWDADGERVVGQLGLVFIEVEEV